MTATIDDVARRAGVSTATVSRAIRGLSTVSPATRERVLAAAKELDYSASRSAASLASGRTRSVGVVVPYVARWFFGQVISGVEAVLSANGFDLLLYNVGDERARERFFADLPIRKRVDAVVVLSLPPTEAEADALRSLRVPLAAVGASVDGFASVRIDDVNGAATGVRHLVNLRHRDIGLISGGRPESLHFSPPLDRRRGYLDVLASAGLELGPEFEAHGDFTLIGGERAMTELLNRSRRPTAVFAQSDEMAIGALRALRRHGLSAPQDISILGFDDHEMADLLDLTTVAQPVQEQGETVARLLLDQLETGSVEPPPATVLPTRLIVRASTAPLHRLDHPNTASAFEVQAFETQASQVGGR